ncbi:MAG: GH3 auxin-responsive promoter family protein [Flavobacteriales bacterium]|nr:GH3 auxin-responsive promoter family protein [Flavobacteriales bacterium]
MPNRDPVLTKILSTARYLTFNVSRNAAKEYQLRTLRKLLSKASHTAFGLQYNFDAILGADDVYEAYKNSVPSGDYLHMLPWWEKAREGQPDITWPGKMENFALSSGTSDGASKYIPVSNEMVKMIRRASMRQVFSIVRTDAPKDHLTKHWLMIGGSTSLNYNGVYYSGDLSGITTSRIPPIFQRVSKPEPEIMSSKNWEEKIERITREAPNWDVGMVAGVPAWIQLLFENIIKTYKLNNIHELWPHLEAYIHGGVSIKPYKESIDKLLGRPIKYFETYLASEGFIAFQTRQDSDGGMRLMLRNGIFHEFIPFNEDNFDSEGKLLANPTAYPIWEVEEGVDYALLITTCSGAWRYLIGDTVRFTNIKKKEIIITGRTKHYISLVGEHLSVDNMTRAVARIARTHQIEINEFALAGIKQDGQFGHRWYLGVKGDLPEGLTTDQLAREIDAHLSELNDDYAVERQHALKSISVDVLPLEYFLQWMEEKGKLGSQHKFPRVIKGDMFKDWQAFLTRKGIRESVPA